jgi:sugar lactone lactonase YvrE
MLVSVGQAVRFAGAAMVLLHFARASRPAELREVAAVDGASRLRAWWHVHLPLDWPLAVGAGLLVAMLGMTELSATMVLLPAGLPSFAQRLLNQMHYAREQYVIAACLILVGAWAALAVAVMGLLALARGARRFSRTTVSALLVLAILAVGGCRRGETGRPRVLAVLGYTGTGAGQFVYPRAAELAPDGTLFVVDKTGRVQHLTRDGETLGSFRMPETNAGKPTSLTLGPDGLLYVADTHYHRVLAFDDAGKIVRQFGRFGEDDGCFIYPTDVAFAPDGRIFVSEYGGNDRISVFSPEGKFLAAFGAPGSGSGELSRPSALCIDAKRRRMYVADACNHRVAIYDLDGLLQGYIGTVGRGAGELRYPYGLALRSDGSLLVCEFGNNRLQALSPDGRSLGVWGMPGRELGQLAFPWDVVVENDTAFVVDAGNNRVQVWRL